MSINCGIGIGNIHLNIECPMRVLKKLQPICPIDDTVITPVLFERGKLLKKGYKKT
jgi:hypothetical protein